MKKNRTVNDLLEQYGFDRNLLSESKTTKVSKESIIKKLPLKSGKGFFVIAKRSVKGGKPQDAISMFETDKSFKVTKDWGSHPSAKGAEGFARNNGLVEGKLSETKLVDASKIKVTTAMLYAGKNKIRKTTKVIMPDGLEITFMDKMSNKEAKKQGVYQWLRSRHPSKKPSELDIMVDEILA